MQHNIVFRNGVYTCVEKSPNISFSIIIIIIRAIVAIYSYIYIYIYIHLEIYVHVKWSSVQIFPHRSDGLSWCLSLQPHEHKPCLSVSLFLSTSIQHRLLILQLGWQCVDSGISDDGNDDCSNSHFTKLMYICIFCYSHHFVR